MGFLSSLFGGVPNLPKWQDQSLTGAQGQAVAANQSSLPGIESLATGVNTFNQQQLTQLLNSIMPGWSGQVTQTGKNISSELKGQIPTDVAQVLQSSDAARSLTGGFGGSGLAGNLTARDLGLTSLNLMGQGESSLNSWSKTIDAMFAPGLFNVSSMFISPQQEFQDAFMNEESAIAQKNKIAFAGAMPNPVYGGLINTGIGLLQGAASFFGPGAAEFTPGEAPAGTVTTGSASYAPGTNPWGL